MAIIAGYSRRRLVQPYKARPLGDLGVLRYLLQIRAIAHPLEYNRSRTTRHTSRNKKLVVRAAELHATNLIQAGVDLVDEFQLWLDLEDGDGVATGIDIASVAVGGKDEGLGKFGRCLGEEDLSRVPVGPSRLDGR